MRPPLSELLPWLLAITVLCAPARSQDSPPDEEEEFDAHGFDTFRIEQEDKLLVPLELREEVWGFLQQRFVDDTEFLRGLDPEFTSYAHEEHFADTYYDTPALQFYGMKSCLRHRRRVNVTDPTDRKSGRELMQIKINQISGNPLERGEVKFEIRYPETIETEEDAHPMLGIVKPSHREPLRHRLAELGIDAWELKPILTIDDVRRRVYLRKAGKPFMSISFDHATSGYWWGRAEFCEIEPELNEIAFTEADETQRTYMESILARVVGEIRTRFPPIQQNLVPKYNKAFDQIESDVPFFRRIVGLGGDKVLLALAGAAVAVIVAIGVVRSRILARSRGTRRELPRPSAG